MIDLKTEKWAEELLGRIYEKEKTVVERNSDKIPYTSGNGVFDDWSDRIGWWTNGFWAGQLWQLYDMFGEAGFKRTAQGIEQKLEANLLDYNGMDHDAGFRYQHTSVASYLLTGDERSKNRALLAAANLAGRINIKAGLFRAWNDNGSGDRAGWAIIDCMMNLPLLYWASKELHDPRFGQLAMLHADTAARVFIREDGSSAHIVSFDPEDGAVLETFGGQGYKTGSAWTRGQAWALNGFVQSYLHTKKELYLHTACRAADYFISNIPENGRIPVDFMQPEEPGYVDMTAAAIAACGLIELSGIFAAGDSQVEDAGSKGGGATAQTVDAGSKGGGAAAQDVNAGIPRPRLKTASCSARALEAEAGKRYLDAAVRLLHALEEDCSWEKDADHFLKSCTAAYHDREHEFPIIYGDYYFTEALCKLCGKDIYRRLLI